MSTTTKRPSDADRRLAADKLSSALREWEQKGSTSLTIALLVEAGYAAMPHLRREGDDGTARCSTCGHDVEIVAETDETVYTLLGEAVLRTVELSCGHVEKIRTDKEGDEK